VNWHGQISRVEKNQVSNGGGREEWGGRNGRHGAIQTKNGQKASKVPRKGEKEKGGEGKEGRGKVTVTECPNQNGLGTVRRGGKGHVIKKRNTTKKRG